jgi:hypothetical protein
MRFWYNKHMRYTLWLTCFALCFGHLRHEIHVAGLRYNLLDERRNVGVGEKSTIIHWRGEKSTQHQSPPELRHKKIACEICKEK